MSDAVYGGSGAQLRSYEDVAKGMVELREVVRKRENEIESLKCELEEWQSDARESAQEIDRLRAALKATNALLEFYLPKGV